jgi:hypothetical protein
MSCRASPSADLRWQSLCGPIPRQTLESQFRPPLTHSDCTTWDLYPCPRIRSWPSWGLTSSLRARRLNKRLSASGIEQSHLYLRAWLQLVKTCLSRKNGGSPAASWHTPNKKQGPRMLRDN